MDILWIAVSTAVTILISLLWFAAWNRLAQKLIEASPPRREVRRYLVVSVVVQLLYNIALSFPQGYYILMEAFDWHIIVMTCQGAVMLLMLYRHYYLPRAVSAIALSYFFVYTMSVTFEALTNMILTAPVLLSDMDESLSLILLYGISILQHLIAYGISFAISMLMDRTRFAMYFGHLFRRSGRACLVCAFCLVIMHSLSIGTLVRPALIDSIGYYILCGALDILMLFAILFVAVFESNREKVKVQEEFILQQQIYVQTLESLQQDLRAFRHDYQNLLSGLYLQASEGDTEAIRETLQKTLRYFDNRLGDQIHRVTGLARIEVPEVKSLLLVKLMEAEEMKVPVELEVPGVVNRVDMSGGDFLRCLGILVDNALEASSTLEGAGVRIALIQEKNTLCVIVANPCVRKPELHMMDRQGYTTKGDGRGTGLSNYRKLTHRYANTVTRSSYQDGVFRQELVIWRKV